uniref:Periplasmic component ABC type Zn2 transporter n=1 Tax=uncultured marine bacterium MedDCM-OCT-S04-C448 TaxID=743057 RepID=D6PD30_9BACT|nr:periplasmic component ABC type Zn2 transporter [uncultured marine bacterium MedDCM-OCT-S04-C448]
MLQQAELFFWVGPQLETFLEKPLASLTNSMISVEMIETKGLQIHQNEKKSFWISGGDEKNFIDPHLWLDPWNAIRMVQRISQELTEADPENAERYQENYKYLQQKLKRLDQHLEQDLGTLKQKPFAVFHPAYTYLEKRFDLMRVGVVNIHPERPPGARHLAKLRRMMQQNGIECLFREPQFEPRLTDMLLQGTKVRSAVLDPLGAELDAGPELYFTLLRNLGKSFRQCLDS